MIFARLTNGCGGTELNNLALDISLASRRAVLVSTNFFIKPQMTNYFHEPRFT